MFNLVSFGLSDMLQCSSGLRQAAAGASTMEEAARSVVGYLDSHFVDKNTGEPALALTRFYKTHPFEGLEPDLQDFAASVAGQGVSLRKVMCLALLATVGERPEWNDRHLSRSHKAIPLPSTEALRDAPMVARLFRQLGADADWVVDPHPSLFREAERTTFDVFFVADAVGSAYVPAQDDFVLPYGIRSVIGFGGALADGSLFAVVMFAKSVIPEATADLFATVALCTKLAVLPYVGGPVFASERVATTEVKPGREDDVELLRSQVVALEQLLEVRQAAVIEQSTRLESALVAARERHDDLVISQKELAVSDARKSAVVDGAFDSIIAIDSTGRVIEWNPAAEATFGYPRADAIGQLLAELIVPYQFRERHNAALRTWAATGEGPALNRRLEVTALRQDGSEFPAELVITPVDAPGTPVFVGYLRDITEHRAAQDLLVESRERFAHVARTLQASLLPPALPAIPGVDLGSVYEAAGAGNEVGGDFYDVFQTGRGDWAVALGDVCGKGPEAAALTALARYTIRAAAMRDAKPTEVLATLNHAVHIQQPDRFCTVAYGRLRISTQRVRLTAGSGGHPPMLIMAPDGTVTELAARGLLIGPFATWKGQEVSVDLAAGESLILYSDGLTEAGHHKDRFESRLAHALSACAGLSAQAIADHLCEAAIDFAGTLDDDLAILVVQIPATP
jgi:PAS domain S-box-containing protein